MAAAMAMPSNERKGAMVEFLTAPLGDLDP
jgi:hypothetical protein